MNLKPALFILGFLLAVLAGAMTIPAIVEWWIGGTEAGGFVIGAGITGFLAGLLVLGFRVDDIAVSRQGGFLLTTAAWVVLPLFGALPLYLSHLNMTLTDAVFEAISGITTTGSTVLTGLDGLAPGILLWRSMLQWLGGIGIIAMGIAVLPFLRVGGMEIFHMESSDRSEKVIPRAKEFATFLLGIYVGLTILCVLAYGVTGMTTFEAVNHAMTTISTGGFSTSDGSLGHFANPATHWVAVAFMLLGGLPFVAYIRMIKGDRTAVFADSQVRGFVVLTALFVAALTVLLVAGSGEDWGAGLRLAAFNVVSIITTTGYASADYTLWGPFAVLAFFFVTFLGGCSGSTSGGLKTYRLQIAAQLVSVSARRYLMPHGVFTAMYAGKPVTDDIRMSVATFIILFAGTIGFLTVLLGLLGLDFLTAFSAAATAVANVGPGIGPVIGPAGTFASLPDTAKWLLDAGMIVGRLEIVTVAVLLAPSFWRW